MSRRQNRAKAKLEAGGIATGISVVGLAPGLAEMLGDLGFDCLVADGEHGAVTDTLFEQLVRVSELTGAVPMMRTHEPGWRISRYLDMGALAVQLPMVQSAEEVRDLVRAVKFPPIGGRGIGNARVRRYGRARMGLDEFIDWSNRETMIFVQLEDLRGFQALPEILQIREVDVIMVGTTDLSQSLGVPGQLKHPRVLELVDETIRLSGRAGRPVGLGVSSAADVEAALERGARYLLSSSTAVVEQGAQSVLRAIP